MGLGSRRLTGTPRTRRERAVQARTIGKTPCRRAACRYPPGHESELSADDPPPIGAATVRAAWLTDLVPDRVHRGTVGRFVIVQGSVPDGVDGHVLVEAAGPASVLRTLQSAGESDEGLDVAAPMVVEGELVVTQHPERDQELTVVELQVREARRVR